MEQLERFKGHFYNWYDTRSLAPLPPRYVSTVDSGNLVGHLLTLRQGLLALPGEPLFGPQVYEGLRTTVRIIRDLPEKQVSGSTVMILEELTIAIEEDRSILNVKNRLEKLAALAAGLTGNDKEDGAGMNDWTSKLSQQIQVFRDDLAEMAPWLELLPVPERYVPAGGCRSDAHDAAEPRLIRIAVGGYRPSMSRSPAVLKKKNGWSGCGPVWPRAAGWPVKGFAGGAISSAMRAIEHRRL
jgi:hypothetical protein